MHFLTIFYFTGHPESDDLFGDHSLPSSSLPNPFWRDPSLYTDKVFHYLREPHPFPFPGRGVRGGLRWLYPFALQSLSSHS